MKRKITTVSLIIGFSILLWVFVSFSGEFSITLNLPTEITDVPEELSVRSVSSDEVSLSLKGQGWQLAQHTLGRDPKFLIPSPTTKGEKKLNTRNALHANAWLSTSLQLVEIHPEIISLNIEETVSKKVEIVPVLSLSYKPGYGLVTKIKIEPDSIEISGPKSLIDEIEFINTKGFGITNLEQEEVINLQLENRKYVNLNNDECVVSFDVQKIVDKTFKDLIVKTSNMPSRYELILSPNKIELTLRGGIDLLSKMKNNDITSYVDFVQAINDTNGFVEPQIHFPEFTSIIDLKPKRLEYIIKKY